jgi:hypothetical protein
MTLILSGTDNSATVPAVTGTDTDTGIYYPAANQVAIATAGTQAMLVDASQNVTFAGYAKLPNTFGFKNRIINGAMVIDQRNAGAAQTITSGSTPYTVDRWLAFGNNASITSQQVAGTGQFQKALQFTGAASVTQALVRQRIESLNTSDLSGATVTIQAYVWGSASGTVNMTLYYPTATDNYASQTTIVDTAFSITTTPTLYTFVVTSLPSGVLNGLEVRFTYGAIGAGVTRTITGVQLEKGSTATSFDVRSYGTELALCERYYWKSTVGTYNAIGAGSVTGSSQVSIYIKYPTTMRATPTVSYSGTVYVFGISNQIVTAISSSYAGNFSGRFDFTPTSTMTVGGGAILFTEQTGTNFVQASAEL